MAKIFFTSRSHKELNNLTRGETKIILSKIKILDIPFPSILNIKKLLGTMSSYRLRVGNIRVIFEADFTKKEIWIRRVGYRKDVYR